LNMNVPRLLRVSAGICWCLVVVREGEAQASTAPPGSDSATGETPVERRVTPRKASPESDKSDRVLAAQPSSDSGIVDPAILERQIHSRFALLDGCPVEVARRQRSAAALKGRRLTLRWTILPNGQVADTAVVATSPVDSRVMDCVKRQMSLWSFSHPLGGPMHLERPFTFRAARQGSR
jgi:hypothetical protein